MREYYMAIGEDPFKVLPVTYLVKGTGDSEFKAFEIMYQQQAELNKVMKAQRIAAITKHLEEKKKGMSKRKRRMALRMKLQENSLSSEEGSGEIEDSFFPDDYEDE